MPHVLHFTRRNEDGPIAGALFPTTPDGFDAIRYGRSYDVDGDAFSQLKRLEERSALFFLVNGGSDVATVRGVFRLDARPILDQDDVDGGYFVKVGVRMVDMSVELTLTAFRDAVPELFFNEGEFYSDLTTGQVRQILQTAQGTEPPVSAANTSRRSSVYGGSGGVGFYDGYYGRRAFPRWEEAERSGYDMESTWGGSYYGGPPPPQLDMHRRLMPGVDRWRNEPRTGSPIPQRPMEPVTRMTVPSMDVGIQTHEDETMIELRRMNERLATDNERLRREVAVKDEQIARSEEEVTKIRMTLFTKFYHEAIQSDDDLSSDNNPAHVESDQRELRVVAENGGHHGDGVHLSPRSEYDARFSPPPLQTAERYSPLPTNTGMQLAESPRPSVQQTAVSEFESALPTEQRVTTDAQQATPVPLANLSSNQNPTPVVQPPYPVSAQVQSGTVPVGVRATMPNAAVASSQLPQYVQPPPISPYAYMQPPPVGPPTIWNAVTPPYLSPMPAPVTAPHGPLVPPRPLQPPIAGDTASQPLVRPPPVVQQPPQHIAIVGGYIRGENSTTIDVFDPRSSSWRKVVDFPTGVSFVCGASAAIDQNIFLIGGFLGCNASKIVRRYNLLSREWDVLSPMPTARTGVAAAELGGKVYAVSEVNKLSDSVDVYDLCTNQWMSALPLRQMRCRHVVTAMPTSNVLFVYGGAGQNTGCINSIEQYDPRHGAWMDVGRLSSPRMCMFGAADSENLYALGGTTQQIHRAVGQVDIFDIRMRMWRSGPELNYPRNEGAAVFLQNDLYVVGGFDEKKTAFRMERRRGNSSSWETGITDGSIDARCFHALLKLNLQIDY